MSATDQPKSVVSVPRDEFATRLEYHNDWIKRAGQIGGPGWDDGKCPLIVSSLFHLATDAIRALAAAPLPQGEHLYDALHGMRSWALEMIRKHADPNGTDYEQGQNDMGHRWVAAIDERLQALAQPAPAPQVDLVSNRKGDLPSEQADRAVLALLDEVSALCTSFNDQVHDADDTLGKINQLTYAGIAALHPDSVRTNK